MVVQHVKHADYYLYLFDFLLIALVNEIIVSNWVNPWELQLNTYAETSLMLYSGLGNIIGLLWVWLCGGTGWAECRPPFTVEQLFCLQGPVAA